MTPACQHPIQALDEDGRVTGTWGIRECYGCRRVECSMRGRVYGRIPHVTPKPTKQIRRTPRKHRGGQPDDTSLLDQHKTTKEK